MTHTSLKEKLLASMASATSQKPRNTELLYMLGDREEVEAALLELYQAHKVGCCKITRRGLERIVWWPVGGICELPRYGTGVPRFARKTGAGAE